MSLLRDRRLAALLVAEMISSTGTQMTWLALPWFVLRNTNSPQRMTWVIIAEVLPVALLGFWGGAIAGRVGTRRTMLTCDLARVPLFAAIPLLHAAGALPFSVLLALVAVSRRLPRAVLLGAARRGPGARRRGAGGGGTGGGAVPGCEPLHHLPRAAAGGRLDQPDRHRERPVRRRGDLPRGVLARRDVRAAAGGRSRRTAHRGARRRCGSSRATSSCGSGRRRSR